MAGIEKSYSKYRVLSVFLSVLILSLLLLSGPANAFILNLEFDDNVDKGDKVVFTANINIESGEILPVNEIILAIGDKTCVFDSSGTMISGCSSMGISNIEKTITSSFESGNRYGYYNGYGYDFGYGYGYSYGKLEYKITLNTQDYEGEYKVILKADINGDLFEGEEKTLTISSKTDSYSSSGGCLTSWTCGEWSECSEGKQTRICKKEISYCYAPVKGKPEETMDCESQTETQSPDSQQIPETQNQEKEQDTESSGITGAVIGTLGISGIIIIIFVAGIVAASVSVKIIRKRRYTRYY